MLPLALALALLVAREQTTHPSFLHFSLGRRSFRSAFSVKSSPLSDRNFEFSSGALLLNGTGLVVVVVVVVPCALPGIEILP